IGCIDGEVLGNYCMLRAMRGRAYAVLAKARADNPGKPVEQSKAAAGIIKQILALTQQCTAIEREYGMTPSSRSRVATPEERKRTPAATTAAGKYLAAG
ncbi:MAG: P27 family phage terminase small subunit, partial [Kiritimatiellae bacterium]|nr:P27 family phage terminase small subunit [Kiritimatiellia bacterium]